MPAPPATQGFLTPAMAAGLIILAHCQLLTPRLKAIRHGGSGGAIADSGTLSLTFVTIDGNSATGHKSTGGGAAIMKGTKTKVETIDSIFDNRKGGNISGGTRRNFQSLGHNLFSDQLRVWLKSTDLIKTNPRLGPLADNGGPTLTQILLHRSPAIDAGVPIVSVSTDQRGFPRSQGRLPTSGPSNCNPRPNGDWPLPNRR